MGHLCQVLLITLPLHHHLMRISKPRKISTSLRPRRFTPLWDNLPLPHLRLSDGWCLNEEHEDVRKLCGPNNLRNVILATTMWEKISEAEGVCRESQLKREFWSDMIAKGSTVAQVFNNPLDAIKLIGKKTMALRLQEELPNGKILIQKPEPRSKRTSRG
jgi:hypothetical protein